jgi:hypothetical protein
MRLSTHSDRTEENGLDLRASINAGSGAAERTMAVRLCMQQIPWP